MLWWVKTRKCPSGKVLRAEGTAAANIKSRGASTFAVLVVGGGGGGMCLPDARWICLEALSLMVLTR